MNVGKLVDLADRGRALMGSRQPTGGEAWFRIANATGERAEVFIYGSIGDDFFPEDVTAHAFVNQLSEITAPTIEVRINSPGGLVFDGIAIYSALRNHPATVEVSVDGLAASAASFVAMAGDTVAVEKPAKLMIHDAQGLALGDAAAMAEMASLLDELSDTIAGVYADRAGGTVESWREAMRATTWYSAADAVAAGLADRVTGEAASSDAATNARSQMIRARARVLLEGGR